MSGHTARCRSMYSPSSSGRTWSVKQYRAMWADLSRSEVELIDVGLVEHRRRPEHDRELTIAGGDRVGLVQRSRGECRSGLHRRARGERSRGVAGQVAEVARVPQLEGLHRAVLDVLAHLRR